MDICRQQQEKLCPFCKAGKLNANLTQFCVDRGDKIMLIGNVPALTCSVCLHDQFDAGTSKELTCKSHAIFAKSTGSMFAYQYSDFIRPTQAASSFKIWDHVRIKADVDTWDLYDEELLPGMTGTVKEKGTNPFDYLVEFRVSRGGKRDSILHVEIDQDDLELVESYDETRSPKRATRKRNARVSALLT